MSTNSNETATMVTIDRVIAAMREHGVELSDDASGRAAHANLNGFNVLFVLLDTVLIARADSETDVANDTPDATYYLSANQVNSSYLDARATIVNRGGKHLIVRTESEVPVAAGLSDAQLSTALKNGVDGIMATQDAMKALVETISAQRDNLGQTEG